MGSDRQQQLSDHRCDSVEMAWACLALPPVGDAAYAHPGRESSRINFTDGWRPDKDATRFFEHLQVLLFLPRVPTKVLASPERRRVDEDGSHDLLGSLLPLRDKR